MGGRDAGEHRCASDGFPLLQGRERLPFSSSEYPVRLGSKQPDLLGYGRRGLFVIPCDHNGAHTAQTCRLNGRGHLRPGGIDHAYEPCEDQAALPLFFRGKLLPQGLKGRGQDPKRLIGHGIQDRQSFSSSFLGQAHNLSAHHDVRASRQHHIGGPLHQGDAIPSLAHHYRHALALRAKGNPAHFFVNPPELPLAESSLLRQAEERYFRGISEYAPILVYFSLGAQSPHRHTVPEVILDLGIQPERLPAQAVQTPAGPKLLHLHLVEGEGARFV